MPDKPDDLEEKIKGFAKRDAANAPTPEHAKLSEFNSQRESLVKKLQTASDADKKILKEQIKTIDDSIADLANKIPNIDIIDKAKQERAARVKKDEERARQYARTHPEAREQLKQIQQQIKGASQEVKKTVDIPGFKQKSSQEQINDLTLRRLKKQIQKESQAALPTFHIPDISKDTATATVIFSLIATFFILAGVGTKFSQLWGYSFNAPISGVGGGEPNEEWDIPSMLHEGIA